MRKLYCLLTATFLLLPLSQKAYGNPAEELLPALPAEPTEALMAEPAQADEVLYTETVITSRKEPQNFYMDIRTNMLYDAALVPNLGVEFYLDQNFTIGGDWMYAWWSKNSRHRYWRLYGGEIYGRWYFGGLAKRKPLAGHHLGVYMQCVTYDFEFGNKGWMGGRPGWSLWERANWGAGIEYGFSLPVAKRINIDFSLGVGYFGGKVLDYEVVDDHYVWQATKRRHWFGPTRAQISLVWLIGRGNVNIKSKKGGSK